MPHIKVVQAGLLTTIQDLGRYGFRRSGISVTGVMDAYSAQVANWLVGNECSDAVLEITVMGPTLTFDSEQLISICGAEMGPMLNGKPIQTWQAVRVFEGDTLNFSGLLGGARAYLAVAGGMDVPIVLESRSTHLKAGFGGFEGRALKKGDLIPINALTERHVQYYDNRCCEEDRKPLKSLVRLRYVLGPHDARFTSEGMALFNSQVYAVSGLCDRMGFRLTGEPLPSVETADIISEPNQVGSIQIPGDGQPILLMQDAGTTGGYTKIGTVIESDLHWIGQLKAGDYVGFECVDRERAVEAAKEQQARMESIKKRVLNPVAGPSKLYAIKVNQVVYEVKVTEVTDI